MAASQKHVQKAIQLDKPERFSLGEIGYNGQKMIDGVSQEELSRELNHPHSMVTFKEMSYHPSINAALTLYNSMIQKASLRFVPPKDATKKEKKNAELVESMFHDMETPIEDVMVDIMSMGTYGFSVLEKVYRRRKYKNGSNFDDDVIGIRKLALRNQESIDKFIYDESGNNLVGVKQDLSLLHDPYNRFTKRAKMTVVLPREKFMLFNIGRNRNNPYGVSPLRDVYLPWKYLTSIEEIEAAGVAKDLQGLPVLYVPAQYMSEDSSPEQKAIYEQMKSIIRNLQNNTQSGVILPSQVDPETRQPLFKLELLSTEGGKKNYDTNAVKDYYRTMIFIGMSADILLMGNTATGSFALGSIKSSLTGAFIEGMLKRIVQVINEDLIKQIYELNGWDISRRCIVEYDGVEDIDLDNFSKAIQRIGAVGYLPKNLEVINKILASLNMDVLPDDANLEELLPDNQSRSGDGMEEGMSNGTGSANSPEDTSTTNTENS
jgi:hypothetical protein